MLTRFGLIVLLLAASITLTGCPGMNIPGLSNSITIINDYQSTSSTRRVIEFGVSRLICGEIEPIPANVLPASLEVGDEFTISGLADGEYIIRYVRSGSITPRVSRQLVEGGVNFKVYYRE
jgi:hypothetical protein